MDRLDLPIEDKRLIQASRGALGEGDSQCTLHTYAMRRHDHDDLRFHGFQQLTHLLHRCGRRGTLLSTRQAWDDAPMWCDTPEYKWHNILLVVGETFAGSREMRWR